VSRILHEQQERARQLLTTHRRGLDLVTQALLEKETIDGAEVSRLVHEGLSAEGISTPAPIAGQ
jgi:cell division protease FtsH